MWHSRLQDLGHYLRTYLGLRELEFKDVKFPVQSISMRSFGGEMHPSERLHAFNPSAPTPFQPTTPDDLEGHRGVWSPKKPAESQLLLRLLMKLPLLLEFLLQLRLVGGS